MKALNKSIAYQYISSCCTDHFWLLLGGTDSENDIPFFENVENIYEIVHKFGVFKLHKFSKKIVIDFFDELTDGNIFEFYLFSDDINTIENVLCKTFQEHGLQKGCTVCLHDSVIEKLRSFIIFIDGELLISSSG